MSAKRAGEKKGEGARGRKKPHDYLSTSCHHGKHDHCRLHCKWCPAPCLCACHQRVELTAKRRAATRKPK